MIQRILKRQILYSSSDKKVSVAGNENWRREILSL